MLIAINKENKQIPARTIMNKPVEEYRCPACLNRVIYRSGPHTIPHFAHRSKESCQAAAESETADHLSGKTNLYRWLLRCNMNVELEKYLADIKQRPDIFIKKDNHSYAIEYQCSPIHEDLFLKRTMGYINAGIVPVWIFHSHFIKRKSPYLWKLTSTLQSALNQSSTVFLLFHNPKLPNSIKALVNVIPASIEDYFGQMINIRLSNVQPLETILFPPHKEISYLNEWFKKRHLQLNNEIRFKGLTSKLMKELYQGGVSPYKIPGFIGIPLLSSCMYRGPAFVWQGLLYVDLKNACKLHESINEGWIRTRFLERIKNKDIILNKCPLINQDLFVALKEYLHFLEKIDYLEVSSANHYIIREEVLLDDNLEEIIRLRLFDFFEGK